MNETYYAVLDLIIGFTVVGVIGAVVVMVIQFGLSGAWARRIEWKNTAAAILIFGTMLLGLRWAPYLALDSTTEGINRAAEAAPAFKEAVARLLGEIREPAERALNVDSGLTIGTPVPEDPYAIIITSTPTAFPIDFPATATAFAQQFPTAVPPESTPMAPTAAPTERPTAAPGDPDWWGHDRPPTPVPGGVRGFGN